MVHPRKRKPRPHTPTVSAPEQEAEDEPSAIVQHPDGYYWQDSEEHQQFGPFETYELAEADRDAANEEDPGAALRESEQGIGITDWIDAETGEPAEGQSPPHLQED